LLAVAFHAQLLQYQVHIAAQNTTTSSTQHSPTHHMPSTTPTLLACQLMPYRLNTPTSCGLPTSYLLPSLPDPLRNEAPDFDMICTTPSLIESSESFNNVNKSSSASAISSGQYIAISCKNIPSVTFHVQRTTCFPITSRSNNTSSGLPKPLDQPMSQVEACGAPSQLPHSF
jgi:hypothetical protein